MAHKAPEERSIEAVFEEVLREEGIFCFMEHTMWEALQGDERLHVEFLDYRCRPKRLDTATGSAAFDRLRRIAMGKTRLLDPDTTEAPEFEKLLARYGSILGKSGGYIELSDRTVAQVEVFHPWLTGRSTKGVAIVLKRHFTEDALRKTKGANLGKLRRLSLRDHKRLEHFLKEL